MLPLEDIPFHIDRDTEHIDKVRLNMRNLNDLTRMIMVNLSSFASRVNQMLSWIGCMG